jgi:hypothetical protein
LWHSKKLLWALKKLLWLVGCEKSKSYLVRQLWFLGKTAVNRPPCSYFSVFSARRRSRRLGRGEVELAVAAQLTFAVELAAAVHGNVRPYSVLSTNFQFTFHNQAITSAPIMRQHVVYCLNTDFTHQRCCLLKKTSKRGKAMNYVRNAGTRRSSCTPSAQCWRMESQVRPGKG